MKKYSLHRLKLYAFLFIWIMLLASCIKEDGPQYTQEAFSRVTLTVEGIGSAGTNEGIRELRVIVVTKGKDGNWKVSKNEIYKDADNINALEYKLEIEDIPNGTTKFFVVANEKALPQEAQNYLKGLATDYSFGKNLDGLKNYVVNDAQRTGFPKLHSEIAANGIPITGYSQEIMVNELTPSVSILIYYMVAKIQVNLSNNTNVGTTQGKNERDIVPDYFTSDAFLANKTYLFPEATGNIRIPAGNAYAAKSSSPGLGYVNSSPEYIIKPTQTRQQVMLVYVYESNATNAHKLSLNTKRATSSTTAKVENFGMKAFYNNPIKRGNFIRVDGNVENKPEVEFKWSVIEWTGYSNDDIPEFN